MKAETRTDAIPGIVPMINVTNLYAETIQPANVDDYNFNSCYEACDASGCDCFDSGDCFDICDRAPDPDFKPSLVVTES